MGFATEVAAPPSDFLPNIQVPRTFATDGQPTVRNMFESLFRHQAECDCGWLGQRRLLRGAAVVEAYQHAALHLEPSKFTTRPYAVSSAR